MKDDNFDKYLKEELHKTKYPPIHLNNILLMEARKKDKFKSINILFFILGILQSMLIIGIGIVFMPYVFMKIIIGILGFVLLHSTIFIYLYKLRRA